MKRFGLRAIITVKREGRDYTFGWKRTYPSYVEATIGIPRFRKTIEQVSLPKKNLSPQDVIINIFVIELDNDGREVSSSILEGV